MRHQIYYIRLRLILNFAHDLATVICARRRILAVLVSILRIRNQSGYFCNMNGETLTRSELRQLNHVGNESATPQLRTI